MGNQDSVPFPLELRFFGPFAALLGGHPLPALRTRKGQWLLALLAMRSPRAIEREWLAATLWPESLPEQALASLRRTLTDLRGALGTEEWRLDAPTTRTLRFLTEGASVDVLQFDAAIRAGDLTVACALYGGPYLEDCPEEWALSDRATREEAFACAQLRHASAAFSQGDFPEAAARWRRLVTMNPLHEPAQRGLMESLCAAGDHGEAIQAYRDLRARLRRDYNAEPGTETTALFDRIRAESRERVRNQAATRPTPRIVATKIPVSIDAAETLPLPRRLPAYLTQFVGREKEIHSLLGLIRARRLVTLVGMGGIGKTRLAVATADRLLDFAPDAIPDGAFFVDLSGTRDGSQIARTVAQAVGLTDLPGDPEAGLVAALESRILLIILDNCEHLIEDAACLSEKLLGQCPGLKILATSREPLRIGGETLLRVPSLSRPDTVGSMDVEGILCHEAVQLFVERAETVNPEFCADAKNLALAAQVCVRLDGIALAIELAAARLSALSLEQVAARLDDRLHLLTAGSRTAQPRQRTLRAALDWSYELLSSAEQTLLRGLSAFASGFTVESACIVCLPDRPEWEVVELLTALVDKSLVSPVGTDRYRLLETVREYSRDRLTESGEDTETLHRFGEYFATQTRTAAERMRQGEQKLAVETLSLEEENIRAAALLLLAEPTTAVVGQKIATTMSRFWTMRNSLGEAARWNERALQATVADDSPDASRIRVRLLGSAGIIARRQGDYVRAQMWQEESLALSRATNDIDGLAAALGNLALIAENTGDYCRSQVLREEGLALERSRDDKVSIALFLHNIANIAQRRRDLETAFVRYEECIALQREIEDREGLSWSLLGYAYTLGNRRDIGGALEGDTLLMRRCLAEAKTLMLELGDKEGLVSTLCNQAIECVHDADVQGAYCLFRESIDLLTTMEGNAAVMEVLDEVACLAWSEGRAQEAAVLAGATNAVMKTQGTRLTPQEICEREEWLTPLCAHLGEEVYAAALAEGSALSLSAALAAARRATE